MAVTVHTNEIKTAGVASGALIAAPTDAVYLFISNNHATSSLHLGFNAAAAVADMQITLIDPPLIFQGDSIVKIRGLTINAIADVANDAVSVFCLRGA